VKYENGAVVPSIARLHVLARLYGLSTAALLAEHDGALPLFTLLDRASVDEIERLVQLLADMLDVNGEHVQTL
jgi:hypothetical protein